MFIVIVTCSGTWVRDIYYNRVLNAQRTISRSELDCLFSFFFFQLKFAGCRSEWYGWVRSGSGSSRIIMSVRQSVGHRNCDSRCEGFTSVRSVENGTNGRYQAEGGMPLLCYIVCVCLYFIVKHHSVFVYVSIYMRWHALRSSMPVDVYRVATMKRDF